MRPLLTILCAAAMLPLTAGDARYEQKTAAARDGFKPSVTTLTAGRWGGAAAERAMGGAFASDGSALIAMAIRGPDALTARVLGADGDPDGQAPTDKTMPESWIDPGLRAVGGMLLRLDADGRTLTPVLRLGRATGSISDVVVHGALVVVAGCGDGRKLRSLGKVVTGDTAATANEAPGKDGGRWPDEFVIAFDSSLKSVAWIAFWPAGGIAPRILPFGDGVLADAGTRLQRISAAGVVTAYDIAGGDGDRRFVAAKPDGSTFLVMGDVNTPTNKEPYRNPYCRHYNATGKQTNSWWSFNPKDLGSDTKVHLESDSSPSAATWNKTGEILMTGWSDGGNSVFSCQPKDLNARHAGYSGFIDSLWGMGVGGVGHILRLDPAANRTVAAGFWQSFVPNDPETFTKKREIGKPNTVSLTGIGLLPNEDLVLTGASATGLIETPDAWYRYPGKGRMGGTFVTVLRGDFSRPRFSTYIPAVIAGLRSVVDARGRILLVGGATKQHSRADAVVPAVKPLQPDFGGGLTDAFIALLDAGTK
jgi:hypothetical protein